MKTIRKTTGIAAIVTAGIVVAGMAPQAAFAHKVAKKAVSHGSSVQSSLERRLQAMEDEISSLKGELARARSESKSDSQATAEKISAHTQQMEERLAADEAHEKTHHDLLFFRGGYAQMEHSRGNELLTSNNALSGLTATPRSDRNGEGWYVGAGFDHRLTDDLWGVSEMASIDGEVMFEYKNYGSNVNGYVGAQLAGISPALNQGMKNQVTQFTLTASPKIKFNNLGAFRPWIIPFGLGIHVISPPSSGVTVLNPGLMLGTGMEVNLWESLWAGIDFRYHFTGDDLNYKYKVGNTTILNKTDTDGLTAGAYLGFGF